MGSSITVLFLKLIFGLLEKRKNVIGASFSEAAGAFYNRGKSSRCNELLSAVLLAKIEARTSKTITICNK